MAMTAAERARNWRDRNPDYNQRYRDQQRAWREKNKDHIRAYTRDQVREARRERKLALIDLLGGKCQRCGFDHPAALDFHHRDPSEKKFDISLRKLARLGTTSWDEVLAEVAKCDLLCRNCHALHHWGEGWEQSLSW